MVEQQTLVLLLMLRYAEKAEESETSPKIEFFVSSDEPVNGSGEGERRQSRWKIDLQEGDSSRHKERKYRISPH